MKPIVFISLLVFTLCFGEKESLGGWTKRSTAENSFEIDQVFKMATKKYASSNGVDPDDLIRLTVYSQVVSGTNYKVTFVDSKANTPAIQEFTVFVPLSLKKELIITAQKEYKIENKNLPKDEPSFKQLEKQLFKFLKDGIERLGYISYVSPVQNEQTKFYFVNADTENGEHLYIICQDRITGEYYDVQKLK